MGNYSPPYTITDQMLGIVSDISEKVGRITGYRELESRPHLRKNNRIRSVHSSLKIEANSLSLTEVRDVINGHLVLGDQKEIHEVKNAYSAYEKIPEIDPMNVRDLKKIHGIMTENIITESGKFRKGAEGVFSGGKCIFIAPPPELVPDLINDLFRWMKKNEDIVHPLIMAAVFHYEFVFIHPFSDGNGRMARLWHTVLLYRWRNIFEYIPLESQIEKYQQEYYDAISKCHAKGNSDAFILFMLKTISNVLDEVISQSSISAFSGSEYVKKLLECMEYDVPYTASALMNMLGMKSRDSFRKNYLTPALDAGLIEMTIPDKPSSRNQRYVKR